MRLNRDWGRLGMSFSEWTEYTVQELVDLKMLDKPLDGNHGGIHPKTQDYVDKGVPFIMANDLKYGKIDYSNCKFITEKQARTLKKGFAKSGDVLLTHKATMGRTAMVDNSNEYIVLTPQVTYYRVLKGIFNKYLKYYFDSKPFQELLLNWAGSGSTRSYLGITGQRKLPVMLPPIQEQKVIADTLSCIDDKIDINNRINKTIEEMAQATFKSWFVDFEPFQEYEFEKSELGKIPKGWSIDAIYDFAKYINGTSFKKDEYATSRCGCPIIKITELKNGISSSTEYFSGTKDEKYYIKTGDILFSWSGNPETSIDIFIWDGGNAILNQHTFKIVITNNDYCFIYLLLKFFKPEFTRIASSKQTTGLGHVTIGDLKRLRFPCNDKVVGEFCTILNPVIEMYVKNLLENKKLRNIRESLLPKLMSGEIRVPMEGVEMNG